MLAPTASPRSNTQNPNLGLQDTFARRHLGIGSPDLHRMLEVLDVESLDELIAQTVPAEILGKGISEVPAALTESELLAELQSLADLNQQHRSFIGQGYYTCLTPPVIQRNILENPGWYTQYTPYQPEIAQGRLEALLNFQTMVSDLTGMDIANASLLDEATAAAEAMLLAHRSRKRKSTANAFLVAADVFPQTIAVMQGRAEPLGIDVIVTDHADFEIDANVFGALVQYPAASGTINTYDALAEELHAVKAQLVVAADLLALTMLREPAAFGADVVVGNTQRFGMPLGYGGPHAAYIAVRDKLKRALPGRLVGVSRDVDGKAAYRLALQAREQHIRRESATSNVCTAQALPAIVASMYGVYHGPDGIRAIAERVHLLTQMAQSSLKSLGYTVSDNVFDTLHISDGPVSASNLLARAEAAGLNLANISMDTVGVSFDEATTTQDLQAVLGVFAPETLRIDINALAAEVDVAIPAEHVRTSDFMMHPVFNSHHSETELLRYMQKLQNRDLSLTHSMIPLGSCTMKLNATAEMMPITWPGFANIHPFVPVDQTKGYAELFERLERWLSDITGFAATSLQPNSGAQGEYAGMLVIRAYHQSNGEGHRDVCLIPSSAHGTNPASAVMAGMKVVIVKTDDEGNIDVDDLRALAEEHADNLSALMVTYPSTHGVFEATIREVCEIVHTNGGQVYMDGANMNAQVGLTSPGEIGADVCHLNLHKTFCIPHGGGGPGMGPIGVAAHLAPFLPGHPVIPTGGDQAVLPVNAAPWSSALILTIPYAYIRMMGPDGLEDATKIAILNGNYIAKRLENHYPVLYKGDNGRVAHECILDLRDLTDETHVTVEDVAKRLMDFGFHAPTMSWPVAGTLMIEPTESESLAELDRFCDAMIAIRAEIAAIADGKADYETSALHNAPHTAQQLMSSDWDRPYSRDDAAYPADWLRDSKFWPHVGRIDNVWGDRNLVCACLPIESYSDTVADAAPAKKAPAGLPDFEWVPVSDMELKQTALHANHVALGGKMIPFAGYDMPVWYKSVSAEHNAVRESAGLFDVSHMGVWQLTGPSAAEFLNQLVGNNVDKLKVGRSMYSHLMLPNGHVLDDLLMYRLGDEHFMLVVNASNDAKDQAWLQAVLAGEVKVDESDPNRTLSGRDSVEFVDLRSETAGAARRNVIALQGPNSNAILNAMGGDLEAVNAMRRNRIVSATIGGFELIVVRTGYTGEKLGYELFAHPDQLPALWDAVMAAGEAHGLLPCGLASRDSLRIEAGLPLYGLELAGDLDLGVDDAGMGWAVKTDKDWFIGKDAFVAHDAERTMEVVQFAFESKGIRAPHYGDPVIDKRGKVIGNVTSAAPGGDGFLRGLAYVSKKAAKPDAIIGIFSKVDESLEPSKTEASVGEKLLIPAWGKIVG